MDSTGDRRSDRSSVADEKGNPFVSFSRLVDQQISNFFRTFSDPTSPFARSKPISDSSSSADIAEQQRRWKQAREESEELEKSFNELFAPRSEEKTVEEECPFVSQREKKAEEARMPVRRIQEVLDYWRQQDLYTQMQEEQNESYEEHAEAERVMDCIRDRFCQLFLRHEDEGDEDMRRIGDASAFLRRLVAGSVVPGFNSDLPTSSLAGYLEESPYSPLHLEHQDPFHEHRAKWRKAFEDLLLVSHGKELSEKQDKPTSSWSWKNSLAERGLVGWNPLGMKMVPADHPEESVTRQPENDASEDAATELDLYGRFLGGQSTRSTTSTSTQTFDNSNGNQAAPDKPSVIATLTTTQRRMLPDGSVHTQVVLKKRFSDGREESTETEHTTYGTQWPDMGKQIPQQSKDATSTSTPSLGHDGRIKQALGQRIEEKKKNGWFWS
ncbi:MAG: hypothetical protein Q9225_002375 [Loekoesia sp. 1 TL-2023]